MPLPLTSDRSPRPPLPMTGEEMRARGWDGVDVVLVSGDAYVDHPSFANGLIARLLEAAGFRVTSTSPAEFAQLIRTDSAVWGKAVALTGFQAD